MRTAPSEIEVILHLYYSPEKHPCSSSATVTNAIEGFLHEGLIVKSDNCESGYVVTDRGGAWVEMICSTPYPELVWRNPVTKEVLKT